MDLVVLHKLLDFGHISQYVCHLLEVHVISIYFILLLVFDCSLCLRIDTIHHMREVLISKADPQIVLVIEVDGPVVGLGLSILTYFANIIYDILIVIVMYNWRNDIKAPIYKQERSSRFTRLQLLVPLVKVFQIGM